MKKKIEKCFRKLVEYGLDTPEKDYFLTANIPHYRNMLSLLPSKPGLKVLELGFGRGHLAIALKYVKGYTVSGIDHPSRTFVKSKEFKEFIKQEQFTFKTVDIITTKLPFATNSFDAVTFSEVIEHLEPDKLSFMFSEIKRVLKPKGTFLVATPNRKRLASLVSSHNAEDEYLQHEGTHGHIKEYTRLELVRVIKENGLHPYKVKMSNFSYLHRGIDFVNSILTWAFPHLSNDLIVVARN